MKQNYEKLKENDDNSTSIEMDDGGGLINITVKHSEDPIINIKLKPTDKVQLFKSTILKVKDKPSFYNCRIIYNGKMLKDEQTIEECKLNNSSVVICSISEPINLQPTIAVIPPLSSTTTNQNSINNIDDNNNGTRSNTILSTNQTILHDDFILDMERARILLNSGGGGINEQTHRSLNTANIGGNPFGIPQNSAARESLELFFGLTFGFFFGPISLFWLNRLESRNAKLGIVVGVMFSVTLSLLRMSNVQGN